LRFWQRLKPPANIASASIRLVSFQECHISQLNLAVLSALVAFLNKLRNKQAKERASPPLSKSQLHPLKIPQASLVKCFAFVDKDTSPLKSHSKTTSKLFDCFWLRILTLVLCTQDC